MNTAHKTMNEIGNRPSQNRATANRFEVTIGGNGHEHLQPDRTQTSLPACEYCLTEPELLTVLAADEQPVVLEGLVSVLSRHPNIKVVGQARNGREAVEQFLALQPSVGMFELHMPLLDGIEAATTILARWPLAQLLIFTNRATEEDVYRAVRAGVLGYALKSATEEELLNSIRTVATGRNWMPSALAAKLAHRIAERELTHREKQVLTAITAGKSNKEIGCALNISEATVKVHVSHILEKLKASGRTEAIRLAAHRGIVRMDSPLAA